VKFLIDAQLPKQLSDFLKLEGHNSLHTIELPKENDTTDNELLSISSKEKRIIVSKDSDFLESFIVKKVPDKLILIKTGNIKNDDLLEIFKKNLDYICNSIAANDLVEINKTEIIIHK
jgi:predicted nuclease of predicted toxin-antitoxin system